MSGAIEKCALLPAVTCVDLPFKRLVRSRGGYEAEQQLGVMKAFVAMVTAGETQSGRPYLAFLEESHPCLVEQPIAIMCNP